jgi:RNA polymerase sigma factor (sigma-70 family)
MSHACRSKPVALTNQFPSTRWSLIQRLDETLSPAATLIERYAPAIRAYLGLKFPDEAADRIDDLSQEVMTGLLERPEVLTKATADTSRKFRFFLMRVAFNLARNAKRRLRHPAEISSEVCRETEPGTGRLDDDQEHMDAAWAIGLLDLALEDCRGWELAGRIEAEAIAMLEASLFEGCGVRELANRFGQSRATCARRVAAAKQLLIRSLTDHLIAIDELDADAGAEEAYHVLQRAVAQHRN